MNARYFGKKVVRDELGHVKAKFNPEVQVAFTEEEKDLAVKRLDATGFDYDLFACGDIYDAHIRVLDRAEGDEFLAAWKDVKKTIKK